VWAHYGNISLPHQNFSALERRGSNTITLLTSKDPLFTVTIAAISGSLPERSLSSKLKCSVAMQGECPRT